jgi:predicted MFS family arabinose efflux permease
MQAQKQPGDPAIAKPRKTPSLQIVLLTLCRLLFFTAQRFVYPFSMVLSRGLGVPLQSITFLISLNSATSLLGPIIGPISDRHGYRRMILAALVMLMIGMLLGGVFAYFPLMFLTFFMTGLGKSAMDPAIQAYVSDRVPYRRRGMFIGLLEVSYAGSALIGIPLVALSIDQINWRAPFFIFGFGALIGFIIIRVTIDQDPDIHHTHPTRYNFYHDFWKPVIKTRPSFGMVGFFFFSGMAIENIFVVYGPWLETRFGLSVVALGLSATVIGFAELCGSILSALSSDRIGLKRTIIVGQIIVIISYAIIPILRLSLETVLTGLFIVFFTFEFTIVTSISLATELLPGQRATMMACLQAASGLGRTFGALIGIPLWLGGGIRANSGISVALCIFGLISISWGLKHWEKY